MCGLMLFAQGRRCEAQAPSVRSTASRGPRHDRAVVQFRLRRHALQRGARLVKTFDARWQYDA